MSYARRNVLGAGAVIGAAGVATKVAPAAFGKPNEPAQCPANTQAPVNPGPGEPRSAKPGPDGCGFIKAATTVAMAPVTVHPGGTREAHRRPNAGGWQDRIEGAAQMAVPDAGPQPVAADFNPGGIGAAMAIM